MCVGKEKVRIDMVLDRFTGRVRVLIIVCCILLVVAAVIVTIGFTRQVQIRKQMLQDELRVTAGQIAAMVNGDGLLSLKPGDEGSPLYLSFAKTIYAARSNNTDISNAYIMRVDNGNITYVIDDFYLTHGLDSSVARIGDPITEDQAVLMAALTGPQSSPDIYTSKWGSFLSGYAPVRDSNGTVVGILGVDETADFVNQYEYANFFNLVEVT
jgi:sensor histidine kinase regulating citrate/malate metabolism